MGILCTLLLTLTNALSGSHGSFIIPLLSQMYRENNTQAQIPSGSS